MTAKALQLRIDEERATTGAADLGAVWRTPIEGLELGLAVRNIGRGISFDRDRGDLPLAVRAGASYRFFRDRLRLAVDLERNRADNKVIVGAGIEARIVAGFHARAGYNSGLEIEDGLSLGLGFALDRFALDYAFVPYGAFGDVHKFAARVAFGEVRRTEEAPVSVVAPAVPPAPAAAETAPSKPAPPPKEERTAPAETPPPAAERPPAAAPPSEIDRILAERVLAEGQAAYDRGDLEAAEAAFERATRLDPTWADAFFNLGTVRYRRERYAEAARAFEAAVRANPADAEAWRYLGFARYGAGDAEGALAAWREAARLDPYDHVSAENAAALEAAGVRGGRPENR
ncbi:MAG: hypothetical protein KatS3mg014_2668 [Actinomycetota bacterium]|nr:MAG: hypothetical protein KatS3mg014_2668 [Actinomycetota bacterium]